MILGGHINGWMSASELEWLAATAADMGSVAEIGSHHGRSSYALLSACPGEVWCVDPWDPGWEYAPGENYSAFMANCGHFDNLHAVRATSLEGARLVPDIDMVFIDGDHSREAVAADIATWAPKARRLICGHDYGQPQWEGTSRAVDEAFADRVERHADSIWAVWL